MGIAGITPFLLKHCPQVVSKLPDRFASISGTTLAVDATLITQRFWFSPDPHIYRHVRGWFRLISELRKSNVNVVCVFDGRTRSGAKTREVQRRESARKLVAARAQVEAARLRRLERILSIAERYQELGAYQECAAAEILRPSRIADASSGSKLSIQALSTASHFKRLAVLYRDYQKSTRRHALATVVSACQVSADNLVDSASDKRKTTTRKAGAEEGRRLVASAPTSEEAPVVLMPSNKTESDERLTKHPLDVPPEVETAATASRLQAQLVAEEGRIWSSILQPTSTTAPEQDDRTDETIQNLRKLLISSQNLLESYSRRQSPPTSLTYDESRIVLNAMRVPFVEAPYPYEAEGVAASLCINGLADFVASEDTDVLVYGATLLRNITTRDEPIIRISGEEVRDALNLTPESFIDLALLIGSDFTERLHGLGPIRATKLIQTFGNIEEIIRSERSKKGNGRRYLPEPKLSEEEYMQQIQDGRTVFGSLPPIPAEWRRLFAETQSMEVHDAEVAEILRGFDLSSEYSKALEEQVNPLEVDYYGGFDYGFHHFGQGSNQTSIYL